MKNVRNLHIFKADLRYPPTAAPTRNPMKVIEVKNEFNQDESQIKLYSVTEYRLIVSSSKAEIDCTYCIAHCRIVKFNIAIQIANICFCYIKCRLIPKICPIRFIISSLDTWIFRHILTKNRITCNKTSKNSKIARRKN